MITIDGISYSWDYIDNDLVLMTEDSSVVFKDGRIEMERIADKELDAAKYNCGVTHWPILAEDEFRGDVMRDEAMIKAFVLGAWSSREIEYEIDIDLKRSA